MIAHTKKELAKYPYFLQAITLCELQGLKWNCLYMDPDGELAITFEGVLTEDNVRDVLMHFMDIIYNDTNVSNISTKKDVDYVVCNRHHADGHSEYTQVFTPDGLSYKNFHYNYAHVQA